jgi:membrane protease YdiL (CAAX protease family)
VFLFAILLALCLAALWWFVRDDIAEYAAFKLLTDTRDRQRRYSIWVLKSFSLFCGATFICLGILSRLQALTVFPAEFPHGLFPKPQLPDTGFLVGFGLAVIAGVVGGAIAMKRLGPKATPAIGDIQSLLPRNGPETACAALLALNAGLSEELFFRLLLPLLLTGLLGNALLSFAIAAVIFGFVHIYQGPAGVAGTTILGLGLTALYVWTQNIWIAAGAHAVLDLFGLVVRPTIVRLLR